MTANTTVTATSFSPRIMELRQKIHDAEYVDFAVQRIAQVLSRKLVDGEEQVFAKKQHELVLAV